MAARESGSGALPTSPLIGAVARQRGGTRARRALTAAGWWALFVTCVLHAGFALAMAGAEVASWLGAGNPSKARGAPTAFVVHAVAGGVALLIVPLQLHAGIRRRWVALHRRLAPYVWAVWLTSVATMATAAAFRVAFSAKVMLWALSILWCLTTTMTVRRAQQGDRTSHEAWATRSLSLTLFFVTFNPWVSGLQTLGYSRDTSYTVGVLLSWGLNLLAAEAWIRARRRNERRDHNW